MSLCVAALGGALLAALPGPDATLAWTHSVERTRWTESYRVADGALRLVEARVQGSGAGMEPPDGARRTSDGWAYAPALPPLPELRLALSAQAGPTSLCGGGRCLTLEDLAPPPAVVILRPCAP